MQHYTPLLYTTLLLHHQPLYTLCSLFSTLYLSIYLCLGDGLIDLLLFVVALMHCAVVHWRIGLCIGLCLGNALINFARVVPDGVLVFFPSYGALNEAIGHWQNAPGAVWERITKLKQVITQRLICLFGWLVD